MKVIINIASKRGHDKEVMTVERAKTAWPFVKYPAVVAIDSEIVKTKREYVRELNRLVNEQREQVEVDVVPQMAGGADVIRLAREPVEHEVWMLAELDEGEKEASWFLGEEGELADDIPAGEAVQVVFDVGGRTFVESFETVTPDGGETLYVTADEYEKHVGYKGFAERSS